VLAQQQPMGRRVADREVVDPDQPHAGLEQPPGTALVEPHRLLGVGVVPR
jgi:hypothetical protein